MIREKKKKNSRFLGTIGTIAIMFVHIAPFVMMRSALYSHRSEPEITRNMIII